MGISISLLLFSHSERKELTSKMKNNLAKRIVNTGDLNDLGVNGFGLEDYEVSAALKNNANDINHAARQVINDWSESYEDAFQAYEELCDILRKINKAAWINTIKK